jgi:hypothetical protein
MGLRLEQLTVEIEGHGLPPIDPVGPHHRHKVTWDDFAEFATDFASVSGSADPWIALEGYHGLVSRHTHLYCHARINFENHNYDEENKSFAGPSVWCVAEYELATAVNRWLLAKERKGVPQILYWSPELMAAQIDAPLWRDRVRRASSASLKLSPIEMRWNTFAVLKAEYPDWRMFRAAEAARHDPSLGAKMAALGKRLRKLFPGVSNIHFVPLHRFLDQLGVRYDFDFGAPAALYGNANG